MATKPSSSLELSLFVTPDDWDVALVSGISLPADEPECNGEPLVLEVSLAASSAFASASIEPFSSAPGRPPAKADVTIMQDTAVMIRCILPIMSEP